MTSHTYLITGGCGFLGQFIVKALHDHDPCTEIRVLDCKPRKTLLNIESLSSVEMYSGDLRNPKSFFDALAGVETVIHSAGLISFKQGDLDILTQANILGSKNLLQVAIDQKCQHFLYISSISAIGQKPDRLSDETMYTDLELKREADPYGYSKLRAELLLQEKSDQIRGIILNPSVIIGPGSHRIEKTLQSLRWIPFCPTVTTLNSFVDVRDVAVAVILALENGRSGERYIVTTDNIGMLPFMQMMMTFMGKNVPVFPIPKTCLKLFDGLVWLMDALYVNPGVKQSKGFNVDKAYSTQKIRAELGWQPKYSIQQSLYDAINFYLGEKDKYESARQNGIAYRRF